MNWKSASLKTRLNLIAVTVLLVGLVGSILIYLTAENYSDSVLGYEMSGGDVYPIKPEDSKTYRHGLELYGGKANLIADEFTRWFDGLWHGKSLAFTVAFIAIVISSVFFFVAHHSQADLKSEDRDENK